MGIGSQFPARAMPMVSPFLGTAFRSGFPGACRCRPPEPSLGMACPFLEQQKTPGKEQPSRLLLSGVHIVCLLLGGFILPALQAAFP